MNPSLDTYLALDDCYLELGYLEKATDQFDYLVRHPWAAFFDGIPHLWSLAHYRLGVVRDFAGDPTAAVEHFDTFLALWEANAPDQVEVQHALSISAALRQKAPATARPHN